MPVTRFTFEDAKTNWFGIIGDVCVFILFEDDLFFDDDRKEEFLFF